MEITELNPKIVWKYFHEITQVPRPSKKEEKIIAYLEKFAKDHGIEYKKDKVGNIVMCKPATPGYEDRVKLILQSHVDMVCEKNAGTVHDFDNDPIRTIIDGEWLHADGTTLGADNGIGCAAQLASRLGRHRTRAYRSPLHHRRRDRYDRCLRPPAWLPHR